MKGQRHPPNNFCPHNIKNTVFKVMCCFSAQPVISYQYEKQLLQADAQGPP